MSHGLSALLLAGLTVAARAISDAGRDLLAHKASGGSLLHGFAITDEHTQGMYYTSNGNGTWTQNRNRAWLEKMNCLGAGGTVTRVTSDIYKPGGSGMTHVTFPSRLLGVAVGLGCSYTFTYNTLEGVSTGGAASTVFVPTILTSFDQGFTWQTVTGFSNKPLSFAQTRQPVSSSDLAAAAPATAAAYPAPDLLSTYCTTRSLCFAVGGYFGTTTAATYNLAVLGSPLTVGPVVTNGHVNPSTGAFPVIAAASLPVAGVVARSTNGGTFWTYVTIPPMVPATSAVTTAGGAQPVPGLTDVSTDSSGRHVYAVGAPFFATDYNPPTANGIPTSLGPGQASAGTYWTTTTPALLSAANIPSSTTVAGTIIYSGSYGVTNSWVVQTAPAIAGLWYGLNAVTVLRGTAALAVGGSPFGVAYDMWYARAVGAYVVNSVTYQAAYTGFSAAAAAPLQQSGVLLMTVNGGFTWTQMVLPGWTYTSETPAPVTANSGTAHLPALRDVACYAVTVAGVPSYNCMAVGNYGYVVQAQIPTATVANSQAAITALVPTWTWQYKNVTQVAQATGYLNLYGITWDNNKVGYMWGQSIILSTHDGGNTWVAETPNAIVTTTATGTLTNVLSVSTVPTTY